MPDLSPSPSPDAALPTPFARAPRRASAATRDVEERGLVGRRVLSGTGEDLGIVVGIEPDRFGQPKKLAFLEHGATEPRYVPLRFVRDITDAAVRLAGPREGYHITRVMQDPPS